MASTPSTINKHKKGIGKDNQLFTINFDWSRVKYPRGNVKNYEESEWSGGEGFYHKAELKQTVILSMQFYTLKQKKKRRVNGDKGWFSF